MAPEDAERPEVRAARLGGDLECLMVGENPATTSLAVAERWVGIYQEILGKEEQVIGRLRELLPTMSRPVRAEAERTNLPVLESQVERFRFRLMLWRLRARELGAGSRLSQADGATAD